MCFTLVEQLHAVEWGQRGEQAGVKTHGQQVPQSTLIKSLSTYTNKTPGSCQLCHCSSNDQFIKMAARELCPLNLQDHLSSCNAVRDSSFSCP